MANVRMKPLDKAADKWVDNAGRASADYADAAEAAGGLWQTRAAGAKGNFKSGISAGGIEDRFAEGIQRAGAAKYARGIKDKGASRYGTGVAAGKQDWQAGFAPYGQVITSTQVPERGVRGDPKNQDRSKLIGDALHKRRAQRAGAGR